MDFRLRHHRSHGKKKQVYIGLDCQEYVEARLPDVVFSSDTWLSLRDYSDLPDASLQAEKRRGHCLVLTLFQVLTTSPAFQNSGVSGFVR